MKDSFVRFFGATSWRASSVTSKPTAPEHPLRQPPTTARAAHPSAGASLSRPNGHYAVATSMHPPGGHHPTRPRPLTCAMAIDERERNALNQFERQQ